MFHWLQQDFVRKKVAQVIASILVWSKFVKEILSRKGGHGLAVLLAGSL